MLCVKTAIIWITFLLSLSPVHPFFLQPITSIPKMNSMYTRSRSVLYMNQNGARPVGENLAKKLIISAGENLSPLSELLVNRAMRDNPMFRPYVHCKSAKDIEQRKKGKWGGIITFLDDASVFPDDAGALILADENGYSVSDIEKYLSVVPENIKKIVLLSRIGVERQNDDMVFKIMHTLDKLDEKNKAEKVFKTLCDEKGIDYTIVRTGKLRGGGGEIGLGGEYYSLPMTPLEDRLGGESWDKENRGFTLVFEEDILEGSTSRILVAESMSKAVNSEMVSNRCVSLISEKGSRYPDFRVAPWEMF